MNGDSKTGVTETKSEQQSVIIQIQENDAEGQGKNTPSPKSIDQPIDAAVKDNSMQTTNQDHVEIQISEEPKKISEDESCKPQILIEKPLCADYRSSSDSDSDSDSDLDSDSSIFSSGSDSSSSDNSCSFNADFTKNQSKKRKSKENTDLSLCDLPPIENLKISVPEEECQEIGIISSIVGTLVVVQAYKGTPALDLDTVLFLDKGQSSLGKVFDVLGPISEPVYTVRFNDEEEITRNCITKGLKVYCAPKTEYTLFVFVSELMKMRGSDASWKNNEEAPPECQDFSDDEEERKFNKAENNAGNHEQPPSTSWINHLTRKKTGVLQPRMNFRKNYRNTFPPKSSQNQRFTNFPRLPPSDGNNTQPPVLQRHRFPMNPFSNPVQPSYINTTYRYPPQIYNGPGICPQGYQGPNYFPQAFPFPQYVFPNPFILPPPGPPPQVTSNRGRSPGNNASQKPATSSRVFGSNVENSS